LTRITLHKHLGFSLTELLISLVLSSIVILAVVSLYASTMASNTATLKITRLDHELRTALNIMANDVRRAGYWGNAYSALGTNLNSNPFQAAATDLTVNAASNCVLFSYDLNNDGLLPALGAGTSDERFGYRLNGNVLQIRPETYASLDCADPSAAWYNLTDPNLVNISAATFTITNADVALSTGSLRTRTIRISLTGNLVTDTTVVRTVTEDVKIRNDLYIP
jgi:prepilin peptidase dependent protein B